MSDHLIGSTIQLLRYGEKYNVVIPKREQLETILKNTQNLLENEKEAISTFNIQNERFNTDKPKVNKILSTDKKHIERSTDNETEPFLIILN